VGVNLLVLVNALKWILKIVMLVVKVGIYPVVYVCILFKTWFINSKMPQSVKVTGTLMHSLFLLLWVTIFIEITSTPPLEFMMDIISFVPIAIEEKLVDFDESSYAGSFNGENGYGGSGDGVSFGGGTYNIDFSKITADTQISLPPGTYQEGSVLQRAQALEIITEICNRPEITITPEQFCGFWYAECRGQITAPGSLTTSIFSSNNSSSSAKGPFQIIDGSWSGCKHSYISKLESRDLNDNDRVDNSSAKSISGEPRPSRVIFSDAAYSAATLFMSKRDSVGFSGPEVRNWLKSTSKLTEKQQGDVMAAKAFMYFSSGHSACCSGFMIDLLSDTINKKGTLAIRPDLANAGSYKPMWKEITGSDCNSTSFPISSSGGLVNYLGNSTYQTSPMGAISGSYKSMWSQNYGYSDGHKLSHCYGIIASNGGKWIYDGLGALASKLPQIKKDSSGVVVDSKELDKFKVDIGKLANQSSLGVQYYTKLIKLGVQNLGIPYALPGDRNYAAPPKTFNCGYFVQYLFTKAGIKNMAYTSAQATYSEYCDNVKAGNEKPGDLIFFQGTYSNGRKITHVGIIVGDNVMMHSGDPSQLTYYNTAYWKKHFYCYGRVRV